MSLVRRGNGELSFDSCRLGGLSPAQEDGVVAWLHGCFSVLIYFAQLRGLKGEEQMLGLPGLKRDSLESTELTQRRALRLRTTKIKFGHLASGPLAGVGQVGFHSQGLLCLEARLG